MDQLYDRIGLSYARYRQPDPRIAARLHAALGDVASVVNVGAGSGSYEPEDRSVLAIEPSLSMIAQRRSRAPVVAASAMRLPLRDRSFDAAMAILTMHHWPDRAAGLAELARVARERVVILTFDPAATSFWLVTDYFPDILDLDRETMPRLDELRFDDAAVEVRPVPIPHDCLDGFLGAYWRRPAAYLDAGARSAISSFALIPDVDRGLDRLARDLDDGTWQRRYGDLLQRDALDLGYRLVIARWRSRAS